MFDFFQFESYLDSNYAPLYHFTTCTTLYDIFDTNKIDVGYFDNPFNTKNIKLVSLTRNSNFSNYKNANTRIELDKNKMILDNYNFIPYDYFIHSKQELFTKSDLRRIKDFEYEEVSLKTIYDVSKYILSINFDNLTFFYMVQREILSYLNRYKLSFKVTINEKEIEINV